jgi:annexin A7/11
MLLSLLFFPLSFSKDFGRDLEKDIKSETSGTYKEVCLKLLEGSRDTGVTIDHERAEGDAERIHKVGNEKKRHST